MKKFGNISKIEKEELTNSAICYYDKHHHNLHPCFIEGVAYILNHLNCKDNINKNNKKLK